MKILSINAGSSTLKFKLFEMPEERLICYGIFDRINLANSSYTITFNNKTIDQQINIKNHEEAVNILIKELIDLVIVNDINDIKGIGHRVVHGGEKYTHALIINDEVLANLNHISPLAPLHNPANITGIEAFNKLLSNCISIAVFDTAFHQTMTKEAYIYPVPYEWYEKYGVRKYGFHGTSHKYIAQELTKMLNNKNLKIISCHLGNGSSICAIKDGISIDTSMGFTPLAGLPMGTRCGDIDVAIIPYMMDKTNMNIDEVMAELNYHSGYLGISGVSSDFRDIEKGLNEGNERCQLAYNIYLNKIVSFISSYNTLLGGADIICFTAGIGENNIDLRKDIIKMLAPLGIYLDETNNNIREQQAKITTENSKIACYVIPTDEELMIARETYEIVSKEG